MVGFTLTAALTMKLLEMFERNREGCYLLASLPGSFLSSSGRTLTIP